ncbi:hypothetical protein Ct61P_06290 [Colletotrichum tofieldiae]|nr:hypothetical protein Ct61P_06290 [Colletotrichum tofieldiae]
MLTNKKLSPSRQAPADELGRSRYPTRLQAKQQRIARAEPGNILPIKLRVMILGLFVQHRKIPGVYASVCRGWQAVINTQKIWEICRGKSLGCSAWCAYKPRRALDSFGYSRDKEDDFERMAQMCLPRRLNTISIFQDHGPASLVFSKANLAPLSSLNPSPWVVLQRDRAFGAVLAKRSLELEQISVASLTKVEHFFQRYQPHFAWEKLQFLAFTSENS